MCSRVPRSTQIINHSCALELLTKHKLSITHVLQSFSLNTKPLINHVLQGPCPTQTSIYIFLIFFQVPIFFPSTTNWSYDVIYFLIFYNCLLQINLECILLPISCNIGKEMMKFHPNILNININ